VPGCNEQLLEGALRRMATDPRVLVRMAASYGSGLLRTTAPAPRIRAVAEELAGALHGDPNALVSTRFGVGQAEADARARAAGEQPAAAATPSGST
jgi:hypothetical protein